MRLGHHLAVGSPRDGHPAERGTGVISTAAAIFAFLAFLLFAVQVVVNLYATSVVSAAGYDAARAVAARDVDHDDPTQVAAAEREAEAQARSLLGEIGSAATFEWSVGTDAVRLHLSVESPGILPSAVSSAGGPRRIDRTFLVRLEQDR